MQIQIDRESGIPIYQQIIRQIRDQIVSGRLAPGTHLAPERELARNLGVNRSTILNAYRELKKEGYVKARVGQGTVVCQQSALPEQAGRPMPWRPLFRRGTSAVLDPLLRDLLELSEREDVISMAIGLPAPEAVPLAAYLEITTALTAEIGAQMLLHCPTEGVTALREALCETMTRREIKCEPSELLILSGSQQGLDIATRVFLDPGDTVIVEEPTYIGALLAFKAAQARLIGIPTDEQGMQTDILASVLQRQRPKFIYTLPTYQNPSGVSMSLARRHHLLELAHRHQIPIIEDDPYFDLRYSGERQPPLKALDENGVVLYLSTASKVLFPGLRLGWLIAPRPAVHKFALAKQSIDLHSNAPGQWVLERFLRGGFYEQHLSDSCPRYIKRRDTMHAALKRHAPAGMHWNKPAGGYYIWCTLPEDVERSLLLARAAEAGVAFLPGWFCFAEDPERAHIRLNFSHPSQSEIRTGIRRLCAAVRKSSVRPRRSQRVKAFTRPVV